MTEVIPKRPILDRVFDATKHFFSDQVITDPTSEEELGYPYSDAKPFQRVIGTLFQRNILTQDYTDAYDRYPLAKRVVDMPIEESFDNDFTLVDLTGEPIPKKQNAQCMALYNRDRIKIIRFCKLVRLFGHSELVMGYTDRNEWDKPVKEKVGFNWVQPIPLPNETELKVSDRIPIKIQSLTTNFGGGTDTFHVSRFIHAMNPKLVVEDKLGQSSLTVIYNALDVQVHSIWSIGQALWRNAAGLLGLYAPKKKQDDEEKRKAIASVANHNAKTVLYIPNGWAVKDILKTSGNIAIQRTYRLILDEIAAGSGIPVSILIGSNYRDPTLSDQQTYFRTVSTTQNNLLTPVMRDYFRKGQRAGLIDPGPIVPKWNPPMYRSLVDKKTEEVQLLILSEIQKRLEGKAATTQLGDNELVKALTLIKRR